MVIKKGYKQTELGMIPEGWDLLKFDDVFEFLDHKRKPVEEKIRNKMHGEYPYYGASGIIDYVNDYIFDDELILLGEDGENIISRNSRLAFKISGKCWVNNHAHVLKPRNDYNVNFLAELLESLNYEKYNSGTAQPKLNKQTIAKIKLVIPSLPEQQMISKNLSDINELIKQLDYLIEKKKNIKQGAMQEILTGKKRLKGFSGKWEIKKLGKLSQMTSGGTPLTTEKSYYGGNIPWAIISDITDSSKYLYSTEKNITEKGLKNSSAKLFDSGTLLFAMYASVGKCCITKINLSCNQAILGIKVNGIDIDFLYYFLSFHEKDFLKKGQTGTQSNLNKGIVENLDILHPSNLKEQKAIGQILSDMDSDIEQLEKQLEKYTNLRQAMMQKLLTGEIRLV